jgi:hypothetical protein
MSKTAVSNPMNIVLKQKLAVASQFPPVAIFSLIFLTCMSIISVNANDTNKTSVVLDGLSLEVTFRCGDNTSVATAECVITNTTSVPVQYESTGPNVGFAFKLLDLAGNQVAKNAEWERLNGVSDMSKHSAKMIQPKDALIFSLPFAEVFRSSWKPGYTLLVEWNPGDDGKGNPLQTGRGLAAELELKADQKKSSGTAPEPQEISSSMPIVVAQQPTLSKQHELSASEAMPSPATIVEPVLSTPWSIIVVLIVIVVAISLFWLLLKKRK